jgi:hypothetical protein
MAFIFIFACFGNKTLHEACFYALSGMPFVWIANELLKEVKETKKFVLVPLHYVFYAFILYVFGDQENKILYSVIWVLVCTIPIYIYEKSGSYFG